MSLCLLLSSPQILRGQTDLARPPESLASGLGSLVFSKVCGLRASPEPGEGSPVPAGFVGRRLPLALRLSLDPPDQGGDGEPSHPPQGPARGEARPGVRQSQAEGRVYSGHSDAHYTVFLHFLTQPWTMWSLGPHSRLLNTS